MMRADSTGAAGKCLCTCDTTRAKVIILPRVLFFPATILIFLSYTKIVITVATGNIFAPKFHQNALQPWLHLGPHWKSFHIDS